MIAKFDPALWRQFFTTASEYICQPSLQLENFSDRKRESLLEQYEDMRIMMAMLVRRMWCKLARAQQITFITIDASKSSAGKSSYHLLEHLQKASYLL